MTSSLSSQRGDKNVASQRRNRLENRDDDGYDDDNGDVTERASGQRCSHDRTGELQEGNESWSLHFGPPELSEATRRTATNSSPLVASYS